MREGYYVMRPFTPLRGEQLIVPCEYGHTTTAMTLCCIGRCWMLQLHYLYKTIHSSVTLYFFSFLSKKCLLSVKTYCRYTLPGEWQSLKHSQSTEITKQCTYNPPQSGPFQTAYHHIVISDHKSSSFLIWSTKLLHHIFSPFIC